MPLAHEAASGARALHDLTFDTPTFVRSRGAEWITGAAAALDAPRRTVTLASGERLEYDRCVIAIGSTSDAPPQLLASEHVNAAKWVGDAIAVREKLHRLRAGGVRRAKIIVAGCALTAVEWAAELATARIEGMELEVSIVGASPRLLREFHPEVGRRASVTLASLGVRVEFGRALNAFADGVARTADGHAYPADLLVWAGGVRPNPALAALGAPLGDDGRVLVTPRLAVHGMDGISAIGDAAQITDAGITWPTMLRAIEAIWQGKTLAHRFARGDASEAGLAHRLRPDFWYGLSLGGEHSAVFRGSRIVEHPRFVGFRRWLQRMYYRRFR